MRSPYNLNKDANFHPERVFEKSGNTSARGIMNDLKRGGLKRKETIAKKRNRPQGAATSAIDLYDHRRCTKKLIIVQKYGFAVNKREDEKVKIE